MRRSAPTVAGLVGVLFMCAACVTFSACARERVEVADSDASATDAALTDVESPIFPVGDGGPDARLVTCGPAPVLGRCPPCANGYLPLDDGGTTCECCP